MRLPGGTVSIMQMNHIQVHVSIFGNISRLWLKAGYACCFAAVVAGGGQVCQVRLHPLARADRGGRGGPTTVKDAADPPLLGCHCQQQVRVLTIAIAISTLGIVYKI